MFRRSTWILLTAFAILLFVLFYLRQRGETPESQPTLSPTQAPLFSFSASAITSLSLENQAGEAVVMQRSVDGTWQLTQPPASETDEARINSALDALSSMTVISTVDPATSLEVIGLQPAEHTLTFSLEGGTSQTLLIGRRTPIGNGNNVRLNSGPVVVVGTFGIEPLLELLQIPPVVEPTPEADVTPDASTTPTQAP